MKEARIECLAPNYKVEDLSLTLRKGDVVFLNEPQANQSTDLAHARQIGAVGVQSVTRSLVQRFSQQKTPRSHSGLTERPPPRAAIPATIPKLDVAPQVENESAVDKPKSRRRSNKTQGGAQ